MSILRQSTIQEIRSYNEAEICDRVISPIVERLGYYASDQLYVRREWQVTYSYFHIGRKNKKKDLPLGKYDYLVGLKGRRGCFVIEAKRAADGIKLADIEQAHSYAAHAQIGANYFVLCDGLSFEIYETLSGANHKPIVRININEIDARFHEIENILSPFFLEKHCKVEYDLGLKLCDGLGSSVDIRAGTYQLDGWCYRILINGQDKTEEMKRLVPQFNELDQKLTTLQQDFELRVSGGRVSRDSEGRIYADVRFQGATKGNMEGMRLLGIDRMIFSTDSKFISNSEISQTNFETKVGFGNKKGALLPQMMGKAVEASTDLEGDVFLSITAFLQSNTVKGTYSGATEYRIRNPLVHDFRMEYEISGSFEMTLIT